MSDIQRICSCIITKNYQTLPCELGGRATTSNGEGCGFEHRLRHTKYNGLVISFAWSAAKAVCVFTFKPRVVPRNRIEPL